MLIGPKGSRPAGTGYLLRRDLVLTARHVLGRAKKAWVQYDRPMGKKHKIEPIESSEFFLASGPCDIALLKLDREVDLEVVPPEPALEGLRDSAPWQSRGWALTSPKRRLVRDSMVAPVGVATAFLPDQERFTLTVKPVLRKADWWRGVSGAPVFERDGARRLLGVIVEADPNALDQLEACPIAGAIADFGEQVGCNAKGDGRARLVEHLRATFAQADSLVLDAIADRSPKWRVARARGSASLCEALLTTENPIAVLQGLNLAHKAVWESPRIGRSVADQIECIALCFAPLAIERRLGLVEEPVAGRRIVRAATKTLVELQAAQIDGKPSQLRLRAKMYPDGVPRLEEPCEVGLDCHGSEMLGKFGQGLDESFLFEEDRMEIEKVRSSANDQKALERLYELVNKQLRHDHEFGDLGRARYLSFSGTYARNRPRFLADLSRFLPSVHLFEERAGDISWEKDLCLSLMSILQRSSGTKKKR